MTGFPEAIEVLTELMRHSGDDRVRLVAAEKIGERGLGKAREFVPDEDASARHDVTAKQLREQLMKLIEKAEKDERNARTKLCIDAVTRAGTLLK